MKQKLTSQIVHAGAGTGKTTDLIANIFSLYNSFKQDKGIEPNFVICTFAVKATQELKERLNEEAVKQKNWPFLDYIHSSSFFISTIDGVLAKFLRTYAHHYGLSPDFEIKISKDDNSIIPLLDDYLFEKHPELLEKMTFFDLKSLFYFYVTKKLAYENISFFNNLDFEKFKKEQTQIENDPARVDDQKFIKDHGDEAFETANFVPFFEEFQKVADKFFDDYLIFKKKQNHLTIVDILLFSLDLLRKKPSIAKEFSKQWDYWFIDEYQDTSWVQEQIFQQITQFKNVFCVGDPKQSIYMFRGADPTVFSRRLQDSQMKTKNLANNYRSHPELISFFNDFFKDTNNFVPFKIPNPNEKSKPNQAEKIQLNPNEKIQSNQDEKTKSNPNEKIQSNQDEKTKSNPNEKIQSNPNEKTKSLKNRIAFLNYDGREEAFNLIYNRIQDLCSQGAKRSDIAILSTRHDSLNAIKKFLKEKNISSLSYNPNHFINNRLILDSLFLLKFLITPYDNNNLIALLRTPYFYSSDSKIIDLCLHYKRALKKEEKRQSLWHFIESNLEKSHLKDSNLQKLREYLILRSQISISKVFEQALLERAFIDLSHYQDPSGVSESNLWKLIHLLQNSDSCLTTFYSLIEENEDKPQEVKSFFDNEAIELMTIHKSKGLEFKHVILCDFSIDQSSKSATKNTSGSEFVFDSKNNKMAFSVPLKNREAQKIKNYGHYKIFSENQMQNKEEKDRLYYVAFTRAKESLSLLIPNAKPKANSWLKDQTFFNEFMQDQDALDSTESIFNLKEGVYQKSNYSIIISKDLKEMLTIINQDIDTPLIKPYASQILKSTQELKSSQDFERSFLEKDTAGNQDHLQKQTPSIDDDEQDIFLIDENNTTEKTNDTTDKTNNANSKKIIKIQMKNTVLKMKLGNQLHYYLQKLSSQSLESVMQQVQNSFLTDQDQLRIKESLEYVYNIKEPDMKFCLKHGHPEWSFKWKQGSNILQGQIDLWSVYQDSIYVFDYKSSLSQKVEKQLIFYSWVLDQMYKPKSIIMMACYPFEKHFKTQTYNSQHQKEIANWLSL